MKTLALLGVAAIAIACDSPTSPRAPLKVPTTTSAAVQFNDRFETVTSVFAFCNDGFITVTAKIHDLFAVTLDAAGGFHLVIHHNFQGVGSNPVTGVNYVATRSENFVVNTAAGFEQTFTVHYNLIAKGRAPNQVLQADFHITITPNGDISSFHNNFRLMCQ